MTQDVTVPPDPQSAGARRSPTIGALRVLTLEPAFARLILAGFISGAGDWFNTVALLGLLLRLTGSPLVVGVSLAIKTVPQLVLAPLAGALADRAPRKLILLLSDIFSALVALSFLLVNSSSRVWLAYVATGLLVVLSIVRQPARVGVTPALVRPASLAAANALEGMVSGSVMLLGAALGGVVSGFLGPTPAFLINAATFLVSAGLILSVRIPHVAPTRARGAAMFSEVIPIIRRSAPLKLLLFLATLWPLGGGATNILLSVYPTQVFHAGDRGIGVLYAAIGCGLILGGLVAPRFASRTQLALSIAFIVDGALQMLASRAPTLTLMAVAIALSTIAAGIGNASAATILMRATPPGALGRVAALQEALSSATFALSLIAAGALLRVIDPRALGLLAGAIIAIGGLLTLLAALALSARRSAGQDPTRGVLLSD